MIAGLLGLRSPDADASLLGVGAWHVNGRKHSSHIVPDRRRPAYSCVAGHTVALADVLTLDGDSFKLDKQTLIRFVDKPVAGAGDQESAARAARKT